MTAVNQNTDPDFPGFKYRAPVDSDTDEQKLEGFVAKKFNTREEFDEAEGEEPDTQWFDNPKLEKEKPKSSIEVDEDLLAKVDELAKSLSASEKAVGILTKQKSDLEDEVKRLGEVIDEMEAGAGSSGAGSDDPAKPAKPAKGKNGK